MTCVVMHAGRCPSETGGVDSDVNDFVHSMTVTRVAVLMVSTLRSISGVARLSLGFQIPR
jgi:hypothetical protein